MKYAAHIKFLFLVTFFIAVPSCRFLNWFEKENETSAIKELKYTISPECKNDSYFFKIKLEFNMDKSGQTSLVVPFSWAAVRKLYSSIENLEIYTSEKKIVSYKKIVDADVERNAPAGGTYLLPKIIAKPGEKVFVTYVMRTSKFFNWHRQNISQDYFHFIGRTTLIHPNIDIDKKIKTIITWKGFPESYQFANSHGVNEIHQVLDIPFRDIKEGVYVGGDFNIHNILYKDQPIVVALRGQWKFSDQEFSDTIATIIKVQRDFWNDYNFPFYFVVLLPTNVASGGDGLHNSFQMCMPEDASLKNMAWLISHEHFHTWNGKRIQMPKVDLGVKWFMEGFTEYYANFLIFKAGLISFEDYIQNINGKLYSYFTSPVRNEPNARIIKDYHSGRNRNIDDLPYLRGALLALYWTTQIKKRTQNKYSLDDVMRDIFQETQKKDIHFSTQLFGKIMQKYCGNDIWNEIEKYVEKGQTIIPDKDALGKCCQLIWKKMKLTDFGFNKQKSLHGKIILEVDENGPAFKAGLRNGQALLEMPSAGKPFGVRIDQLFKIKIKDLDGSIKTIEFYPVGDKVIDVPQYVLDKEKYSENKEKCLNWFGIN